MSKLSSDTVRDNVRKILVGAEAKKRNFVETIELQVALKNYDAARDKRIAGQVKLPVVPKPKSRVCILGDARTCDQAKDKNLEYMSEEDLTKLNRNKKLVKKLAQKYDAFLASASLIKKIPRLLGPTLNKAGKFPGVLAPNADPSEKVQEIASTIKFNLRIKKDRPMCMGTAVANVGMSEDDIVTNVNLAVNFMVSLLKKKWHNCKRLYLKSTMGPAYKIYGF
uniref:Ribosomal protein n=1 Tax=Spongospora subterranea TaxID=70186 RepID=A0A0H5R4M5_9EUKA|eukprot:CRZ08841.1 hypothetical protein [Spongospora subterranea]